MNNIIRKLLVGVASLVLEALSVSKEQIIHQRQLMAALRRVNQCEIILGMTIADGHPDDIQTAQKHLGDARTAFHAMYTNSQEQQ
ncbi:hypothetical protein Q0A17_06315 [Citrobacter sp. S2-9]|uniref:Uncharacterized protein n=1 Tax=Citrobacter enshiensis TaxID=2971264 RepID=A0ABT8PSK6_9ENTR|nr:hypothetical protein [Citrobacter enshiensis]MDN8599028.1 hypothetical protein [Citrobacter enshiensis]